MQNPQWLVPPSLQYLTPNRYHDGYRPDRVAAVEAVVLHFTVGGSGEGSARYLSNQARHPDGTVLDAKASAHFVVDRDGTVRQLAPLGDRCWHAGSRGPDRSEWRGRSPNSCTIGIEIANYGPLFRVGAQWVTWWGKPFRGTVVPNPLPLGDDDLAGDLIRQWCSHHSLEAPASTDGKPFELIAWEAYPEAQVAAVRWLTDTLAALFPVLRTADEAPGEQSRIAAHSDCDPWRKLDSGPAFPIDALRSIVQG